MAWVQVQVQEQKGQKNPRGQRINIRPNRRDVEKYSHLRS